ncbi:MAG: tetratricopeptide repeat protein [Anaerolineae bacterium]|nr:tetratricopeptide repeat protein [Anaerolineae bacterium]
MPTPIGSGYFVQLDIPDEAFAAYRQGKELAAHHQYKEAITEFGRAVAFMEAPPAFRARVFERRGECYWYLGEFAAAGQDYRAALETCDDPGQIARARARLGEVADSVGQFSEAVSLFNTALREGLAAADLIAIGRAQRGLGIVQRRQGNTDQAINHLSQALAAFRQAGDARQQARVLSSLGRTRFARGEYQAAISAMQEALKIDEAMGDRWRYVLGLNDLGECHRALYDIDTARQYHEQALEMAERYGANVIKPDIQHNLGSDLVEAGRIRMGVVHLQQALDGARSLNKRETEAMILYSLIPAYIELKELSLAQQAVADLSALANTINADRYRSLAAFRRGELLFAQGSKVPAVAELQTAMLAAQTSLDIGILWRLHALMSQVVDDEAIANVHRQIAVGFIRQAVDPLHDPQLRARFVNALPVKTILQAAGIDPNRL